MKGIGVLPRNSMENLSPSTNLQKLQYSLVNNLKLNMKRLLKSVKWAYKDLLKLRNQVENAGIRLLALENLPFSFYDKIMMGQPGREEQLKHVQETIYNMGSAGIPVLVSCHSPIDA